METNGEVSRIEIILEGDQIGPLTHIHPSQRERYHVSDGELTVKLGGKKTVLKAGDQIEVPVGAAHTFANRSDRPVSFIAEHLPALRFEEYIRSVHAFMTSDVAGGRRDPRTLMRYLRLESGYTETIRPPAGIPGSSSPLSTVSDASLATRPVDSRPASIRVKAAPFWHDAPGDTVMATA